MWNASKEQKNISAVVFDFGRVLTREPDPAVFAELARWGGVSVPVMEKQYFAHRSGYDAGLLSAMEYWSAVFPCREIDLDRLVRLDGELWGRVNEDTQTLFEELAARGVALGVLSNMPLEGKYFYLQCFPFLFKARKRLFSCEVHTVKPGADIYRIFLEDWPFPAGQTLFVDDLPANVEAARQAGFHAEVFTSCQELRTMLITQYSLQERTLHVC